MGMPLFVVLFRILGACPSSAKPYKVRDDVYLSVSVETIVTKDRGVLHKSIASREYTSYQQGIRDVRKHTDAEVLHCNDVRRGTSSASAAGAARGALCYCARVRFAEEFTIEGDVVVL